LNRLNLWLTPFGDAQQLSQDIRSSRKLLYELRAIFPQISALFRWISVINFYFKNY
jgi:hypothetical protein